MNTGWRPAVTALIRGPRTPSPGRRRVRLELVLGLGLGQPQAAKPGSARNRLASAGRDRRLANAVFWSRACCSSGCSACGWSSSGGADGWRNLVPLPSFVLGFAYAQATSPA